jgi:hypothetical protein
MHRSYWAIAGVVLGVTVAVSGCGGDSGPAPGAGFLDSTTETVQFKTTDTNQFNALTKEMQKNMRDKTYTKRPTPPKKEEAKKP